LAGMWVCSATVSASKPRSSIAVASDTGSMVSSLTKVEIPNLIWLPPRSRRVVRTMRTNRLIPGAGVVHAGAARLCPVTVTLDELWAAVPAHACGRAGGPVGAAGVCRVGTVAVRMLGRGRGCGMVGWSLRGLLAGVPADLAGIPTSRARMHRAETSRAEHPNGATGIDHVVLMS